MQRNTLTILSDNVKRLRAAADWSQPELARRSGVAQTSISAIENGKHQASVEKVERLAHAFKIPPWALLLPDIDPALFRANGLDKVVDQFVAVRAEGRNEISRVAEREARYALAKKLDPV